MCRNIQYVCLCFRTPPIQIFCHRLFKAVSLFCVVVNCGAQLLGYSIICSVVASTLLLTPCVCCFLQVVCVRGGQALAVPSEPALLRLTAGGAAEPKWYPSPSVSTHTRAHTHTHAVSKRTQDRFHSLTAHCLNSGKPSTMSSPFALILM